jgi:uncharacterized protein (TIGR02611 family)
MERWSRRWKQVPVAVRKPLVLMVGIAVVAAGLAGLILPILPGWALIFVGFAILATEFAVAEKVRDWLITQLKAIAKHANHLWHKIILRK